MANTNPIPTEKIQDRLRFENPWWKTPSIPQSLASMKRRLYFEHFFPLVQDLSIRRAIILMGPRRVGKTVMMHQALHGLLEIGYLSPLPRFHRD